VVGPEPIVFKDCDIPLRLFLRCRDPTYWTFPKLISLRVQLQDNTGWPISRIMFGRFAGEDILTCGVCKNVSVVGSDVYSRQLSLPSVRVREVSSKHGDKAFRLFFELVEFPSVCTRSEPFFVKCERMKTPSYKLQSDKQRKRRIENASKQPQTKHVHSATGDITVQQASSDTRASTTIIQHSIHAMPASTAIMSQLEGEAHVRTAVGTVTELPEDLVSGMLEQHLQPRKD